MVNRALALGLTCFLFAAAGAQDDNSRNAESKLLAVENAWNQAEAKGDTKALNLIFDDSMVYVDEDGAMLTKSKFLARAKAESLHLQSISTQSMNVQIYGDTAVVSGIYRAKGIDHGKPYQREGRFTDVWVSENATWVSVAVQSTPIAH